MAQTKATKKFEKNRLKDTLKNRKDFAKIKQRHQVKAKKKAKRTQTNGEGDGDKGESGSTEDKKTKDTFGDMSVDDFFAGGFEIPQKAKDVKKRAGKRKRVENEDASDDESSVASVEEHVTFGDSEAEEEDVHDNADTHMDDLKALEEKDPEFFKYLKENDKELLEFAADEDMPTLEDLSDSGEESTKRSKKAVRQKSEDDGTDITVATIKKWSTAMKSQYSLRAMREMVLAFRAAAHLNEEDGKTYKYTVSNANVYHQILHGSLELVPVVLQHHVPIKELSNERIRVPTDTKKFRTLAPLIKSHTASVQHLLETLSDAASIKMTLASLHALLPYTLSFKKQIRDLSRSIADIWSDSANDEAIRISAFLILRRLSIIGDQGIKEHILRSAYQGLIKGSRTTTIYNLPGINLMKNSAAELWGLVDANIAYTTGFTFIRQSAIHLRNSIKHNANDAYKTVYNWQYVHSLDFWSRVLSMHCETLREASSGKESPLRPLIYPLTQVTLGAMRLIPTAAYFPLRFHLIRSLLRLSQATNTYIPLAAPLYEVLTSAEMKKPPKPSTVKPLDFDTNIRASKSFLRTRVYQDGVGEQVAELLADFFTLWCKNIAFPELVLPVTVMLRRWLKEVSPFAKPGAQSNGFKGGKRRSQVKNDVNAGGNKNSKVNGAIVLLLQKLDANAKFVEERRKKVDFAPNDRAGVESFLKEVGWEEMPLGAFVVGQRKAREERRRLVEEGRREEARKKKEEREEADDEVEGFGSSDDSENDDVEMEDEEELEGEEEDEIEFDDEGDEME